MEAVRTAPRPFLTVKEVMILLGCKEDFAYKTMRKINKESESQGYISIGSGKVNKTDVRTMMETGETFRWHIPEQSPRASYRRI